MKWVIIAACFFSLTFFLSMKSFRELSALGNQKFILYKQIGGGHRFPAGPMLDGFVISDNFFVNSKEIFFKSNDQNLCFDFFMANYSGRKHGSSLVFSAEISGKTFEQTHSVTAVKDNAFHKVCFDIKNQISSLKGPVHFRVKADGTLPDQAITFWLSPDLRQGETLLNGKPSGGSLIASIALEQRKSTAFPFVIFGLLFCYCAMILLIFKEWLKWFFCQIWGRRSS